MKKLLVVLAAGLFAVVTGFATQPSSDGGPTVAILGDSYSGFAGAVPTGFNPRYPQYTVNRVEKMWWHLFMENYGARLLHADSCNGWRGTYISMKSDADNLPSFIRASRLNALGDGLGGDGDPDIILVNGGTNDAWNNTDRGTELDCYNSATWTAANLVKFRPAVAYMLNYLKTRYVNAEIIVVINSTDDGSKGISDGYADDLEEISAHYGVLSVRTHGVEKCESHPTAAGMRTIAQQVIAARNAAHEDMDGLTASVSGEVLSVTVAANAFVEPRDLYLVWDTADRGTALDGWANVEKIAANVGSAGDSVEVNLTEKGIYDTKVFRVLASKSVSCDYLLATLESSGSQYIDLGYTMDITADSFEAELSFPSLVAGTNVKGVFGARDGYYSGDIALQVYKQANNFYNDRCNCNNTDSSTDRATVTPAVGATYTCFNSFDSRETYTAGVRTSRSTTNVGPAPGGKASGNAYVFAMNAKSEASDRQPTTLTSLSVWTNSTVLAWDLVPCLADGKGALYNRVTGEILTNDGTDDFICGAIRQDAAAATSVQSGQGEEPAALTVTSAEGAITVTVAAGAVTESTPVYLAWDDEDKGDTLTAWAHSAKIDDVDAEGGSFNVEGATLKIPNGAAIRAFLADGSIDLYATLTKPKAVSGLVDTLYQPGKQTKGFDLGVKFAGTWSGTGDNVLIMGIWDFTSAAVAEAGSTAGKEVIAANFATSGVSLNPWIHAYNHKSWSGKSYTLNNVGNILTGLDTITLRTGRQPQWGDVTATNPWPEDAPNYDFTVTMPVFGMRRVNANGTVTDYPLNGYDMTLSVFRIYEKPESAHVCVREYVPAEKDGVKGLYETMNGTFCPASATGFTLGGSSTNTIYTASTASTAATYSGGDTPEPPVGPTVVTVTPNANQSKTEGADDPTLTYTLSEDIEVEGALARAKGEEVGIYAINLGTLKAADESAYTLVLAATPVNFEIKAAEPEPPEPPSGDGVSVTSSSGAITVTIDADTVTAPTPVYLVWDETDKGDTFADWTNKAKLGDVDAAGDTFTTNGLDLAISNGAAIRAFVMNGDKINLYATLTKPKAVSGMVDTLYQPGKQTKGFDLGVQFAGTWSGTGNNVLIMGVWDLTTVACEESGKAKEVLACNFSSATSLNAWPHVYQHTAAWANGSYALNVNTTILSNPNTITLRTGQEPTWGTATAKDPWPEAAPNYDFTVTMPVFGMRQVNANGTVTDYPLNGYDMTLSVFRIYEKPASAHECVREYVPAEKDGVKGLYETMNGTFCPASVTGFTLGGSPTNTIYTASTASTAATYSEGGEEPPAKKRGLIIYGTR